jgi:hypothetical protein
VDGGLREQGTGGKLEPIEFHGFQIANLSACNALQQRCSGGATSFEMMRGYYGGWYGHVSDSEVSDLFPSLLRVYHQRSRLSLATSSTLATITLPFSSVLPWRTSSNDFSMPSYSSRRQIATSSIV